MAFSTGFLLTGAYELLMNFAKFTAIKSKIDGFTTLTSPFFPFTAVYVGKLVQFMTLDHHNHKY
jgi:hypothetical protein